MGFMTCSAFSNHPIFVVAAAHWPVAAVTLFRWGRRRAAFGDIACLFLALFIVSGGGRAEHAVNRQLAKARYLFMIVLPAFYLLGAESLGRLMYWFIGLILPRIPHIASAAVGLAAALAGLVIIAVWWGGGVWQMAHAQGTGNYNNAFAYVGQNLQPGDKIMTVHSSAAYLYLRQSDYYANQVTAKVLEDEEENMVVDRYVGSPLIDSVESFNDVLASGARIWFVVDRSRLYRRYETFFTQQIFAQMDHIFSVGGVDVFISRPFPIPLPADPSTPLNGNFGNQIILSGYSLNPANLSPDGVIPLALYWQPVLDSLPTSGEAPKVFVQLRDRQGRTVAQADHFFYEGLFTLDAWQNLKKDQDWLRDSADLQIPLPLPPENGPYRIFVGLYSPATQERIPLLNDTTGENAVTIEFPQP